MTLIDVQDGGLARNDKFDVTVGVIRLVVTDGDAAPSTITGYCRPEIQRSLIRLLNHEIVWDQTDMVIQGLLKGN